jgi:hypothetical protein
MKKSFNVGLMAVLLTLTAGAIACNGGGSKSTPPPPAPPANPVPAASALNVTTYHNDNSRTGQNLHETILTRANVNPSSFGKIAALPVDGVVYAQPLYVQNVKVSGTVHNLLFVETEHDSVYAFDETTLSTTPVWSRSFLGDADLACTDCTSLSYLNTEAPNIYPEIGITATPVIDMSNGIMYVIATTIESGVTYQKIHGLYIDSGKEIPGSPVIVEPTLPGSGDGASTDSPSVISFNAVRQMSRAALTLNNGMVFAAFSSYNDQEPSHGWVVAFSANNLTAMGAWMSTPNSGDGNIWMSGDGPVVDSSGNLYLATANGDASLLTPADRNDSVVNLSVSSAGALTLTDYFQPYNYVALAEGDVEMGSGGVMALPDQAGPYPHLLLAGGKQGTIYLLNRDNLGQNILDTNASATSDTQIVQEITGILPGGKNYGAGIYSTPAYFNGSVFYCGAADYLRSFPVVNGQLDTASMQVANEKVVREGSTPSISANGTENGIVWTADASAYTYSWSYPNINILTNGPSVLRAYSTDDLSAPLYESSGQTADAAGDATKFAVPTVADGKVFLGTQTEISVYGLKSASNSNIKLRPLALDSRSPASLPSSIYASKRTSPAMWLGPGPNSLGDKDADLPSCGMAKGAKF